MVIDANNKAAKGDDFNTSIIIVDAREKNLNRIESNMYVCDSNAEIRRQRERIAISKECCLSSRHIYRAAPSFLSRVSSPAMLDLKSSENEARCSRWQIEASSQMAT